MIRGLQVPIEWCVLLNYLKLRGCLLTDFATVQEYCCGIGVRDMKTVFFLLLFRERPARVAYLLYMFY